MLPDPSMTSTFTRNMAIKVEIVVWLADQLEVRLAKARAQVDALTLFLPARAFAGQLIPKTPPTNQRKNC